jgi:2'-5' RNA ligase
MAGHSSPGEHAQRYRVFVAVALPEAVRYAIEAAQNELRAAMHSPSIRWTRPEQLHLTLRFLGGVDVRQVEPLKESVRDACDGFGGFQLSASGLGVFPNVRRPRVVWAGIDDANGRLSELQRSIQSATSAFTSEPPEDRFTGHVTLARCRDAGRGEAATLAGMIGRMATRSFGAWTVSDVEVIRSETLPTGSRYSTLAQVRLSRPAL